MHNDVGAYRTSNSTGDTMKKREHSSLGHVLRIPSLVVVGLWVGSAASSVVAAQTNNSMATRLQALEDRAAVEELIVSGYSTAIDARDWKALAALFTEDGDFKLLAKQFPPREFKGRAAIEKAFAPSADMPMPDVSALSGGLPVSMKHVITNPHVRLDGDRATATAYWMEVAIMTDGNTHVAATGYYHDTLKRDGRGWKFKVREVYAYDMPVIGGTEPVASPSAPAQR